MGKCLKCSLYKFIYYGKQALAKRKIEMNDKDDERPSSLSQSNNKKVKLIYGKDKEI